MFSLFFKRSFFAVCTIALLGSISGLQAAFIDENGGWVVNPKNPTDVLPAYPLNEASGTGASSPDDQIRYGETWSELVQSIIPGGSYADEITPEIAQQAKALRHDPLLIYNFVFSTIRFELYYGAKRGAHLTLLEGVGNDADQCLLLAALLRASGFDPSYQKRYYCTNAIGKFNFYDAEEFWGVSKTAAVNFPHFISKASLRSRWTDAQVSEYNYLRHVLLKSGYPDSSISMPIDVSWADGSIAYHVYTVKFFHSVLGEISLAPWDKCHKQISVNQLGLPLNFNPQQFLNSTGPNPSGTALLRQVNKPALLSGIQQAVVSTMAQLKNQYGNWSSDELFSRRVAPELTRPRVNLNSLIPYPGGLYVLGAGAWFNVVATYSVFPEDEMLKYKFKFDDAAEATFTGPRLSNKRLAIRHEGNRVKLKLDDEDILAANITAGTYKFTVKVIDPVFGEQSEISRSNTKNDNYLYAFTHGFTEGGKVVAVREAILANYTNEARSRFPSAFSGTLLNYDAISDATLRWKLLAETLYIKGLSYNRDCNYVGNISYRMADCYGLTLWSFGRIFQETTYGFDVSNTHAFWPNIDLLATPKAQHKAYLAAGLLKSGLEHAHLEYDMGESDQAVSTVQLLDMAYSNPADGLVWATSANWDNAATYLSAYSPAEQTSLKSWLAKPNSWAVLPRAKVYSRNIWSGFAYLATAPNVALYAIGNGSNVNFGGYGTRAEPTPTPTITIPKDVGKDPGIAARTNPPTPLADSNSNKQYKNDPIDFYNGAYYFDHTDLAVGLSSGVRGLAFSRSYRSNRSNLDLAGLGPGWSHNYYARAFVRTSTDAAFGQSNPAAASTIIASLAIMQSILGDTPNLESVGKSAVIAKLALDQVLNNAIAIQLGEETHEFVRQADGSYVSPIRSTLTLTRSGDTLTLRQRHGDTYTFDLAAGGRLTRAVDPFGLEQLYSYTGDLLTTVRDAYSRTLTFAYHPGTSLISSVTDSTGRVTRYDYEQGNLTRYTDPENKATRYAYSGKLLTEIRDARDRLTLRSAYNAENAVDQQWNTGDPAKHYQYVFSAYRSAELNPLKGLDVTYYDARARPSRLVNALGEVTRYTYDGQNRPLTITNARGHTTTHTYNPDHTLATTTDPLGLTTLHTYDDYHRVLTTTLRDTDPATPDRVTTFTYLPGDTTTTRPETITTPDGIRTRFAYYPSGGAIGQLYTSTQETTLGNFTTTYEYDLLGQPTRVTAPDDRVTRTTYDARGVLTDSYDAADTRTHYEYNLRRQPTLITAAYGTADASTVRTRYDDVGDPLETTDPTGIVTRYETDALGKVLSTTHAYGTALARTSTTLYDVLDRPARDTDPTGRWTRYLYDAVGRRTAVVNSYQHAATILYDAVGQPSKTATPLQFTTKYTRDARGFATEETDPLNLTLYRTPDGYGAPATLKNRLGHTWTFHTDAAGRSTGLSTPLGYRQETRYNARGLPTPLIEPSRQETSFVYDAAGRPDTRTDALGTLSYHYDAAGRPDRLTEGSAVLRADHDLLGRVHTHTDARGRQIGYGYDPAGRLTTLTYPGGFSVTYAYDVAGRLHTLTDSQGRVTRYRYDSADRLLETIRPNGTRRLQGYDAAGRLDYLHESDPANRSLLWRKFGYDADGRLTALRSLPVPQGFTETVPAAAYDADNRLTTWGGLSTAFDADGNLTSGPAPAVAGLASYGYDSRNRLIATGQYSFGYDAADQRTTLTGPAGTTRYTIDPYGGGLPRVLVRERPDGSTTTYVYGHGLAYEIDSATGVRHYHGDHLGSTIALTDADGRLTDEVEYSPYGRITRRTGTTNTPFLYVGLAGVQTDPTGLLYMRARYYSPQLMRFVNADPIGFGGGMNWYAYANGNPVSYVDPDGQFAQFIIGAAIGVAVQGAIDLYRGETSSFAAYAGAAAGGALTGGLSSFVRGAGTAALVGAAGGATSNAYRQSIEVLQGDRTELSGSSFAMETGFGAAGSAVASKVVPAALSTLSNATKGTIGEYTSLASNLVRGNVPAGGPGIGSQVRIPGGGRNPIWDWQFENVFTGTATTVESKFGTAGLTSAQRAAAPYMSNLSVERWTYGFWGQAGAFGGGIGGSGAGRK